MSKRVKSTFAVFVFEQLDLIFPCVLAIHARRTICKDYVMICLSIPYEISLAGNDDNIYEVGNANYSTSVFDVMMVILIPLHLKNSLVKLRGRVTIFRN